VVISRLGGHPGARLRHHTIAPGAIEAPRFPVIVSNVDLFVYLDPELWLRRDGEPPNPARALGRILARLEKTHRGHIQNGFVTLRRQDHSIRIRYSGAGAMDVEVVPALWDRNKAIRVLIPERATGRWVETSVRRQLLLLDKLDHRNRYLRRAIRLLKYWRNELRLTLRSYALEILAAERVIVGSSRHPSAVFTDVLEHIATTGLADPIVLHDYVSRVEYGRLPRRPGAILDPAVPGNDVADNLNGLDVRHIGACARRTLAAIARAERELDRGHLRDAKTHFNTAWRRARRTC
jgi:hypothetical protein